MCGLALVAVALSAVARSAFTRRSVTWSRLARLVGWGGILARFAGWPILWRARLGTLATGFSILRRAATGGRSLRTTGWTFAGFRAAVCAFARLVERGRTRESRLVATRAPHGVAQFVHLFGEMADLVAHLLQFGSNSSGHAA
jgi:hypothetical protein